MPVYQNLVTGTMLMGKLDFGADLLDQLTRIASEKNIRLGRVEAIGAVSQARIGFYDQKQQTYQFHTFEAPMEITALLGNISLKDDRPMVHAHITLTDERGRAIGGHLAQGCRIFACEFFMQAFEGKALIRGLDMQTGLPLWEEI